MNEEEGIIRCSKCKRPMVYFKETWLCVICDSSILWDLATPNTREEEKKWVEKNIGVNNEK